TLPRTLPRGTVDGTRLNYGMRVVLALNHTVIIQVTFLYNRMGTSGNSIHERNLVAVLMDQNMARIYHNASCVLVWLGEQDAQSDVAFDLVIKMAGASR